MPDLPLNIREYPGYHGMFTRDQAEGAIPNGARIVKIWTEKGDAHPVGALGTVLGSIKAPTPELAAKSPLFYFIEWDARPCIAVGVLSRKIEAVGA